MRPIAISLCAATLALAACGGEDKGKGLPSGTASELLSELAAVQNRLDQGSVGACEDVLDESIPAIQKKLDSLPENTDAELRTALEESVTKLRTLSEEDCDTKRQEAEDKEKKKTTETTPPPTTTETTPPPTTTTETTPPTTTETTPEPKPKDDGGNDGGSGKGKGNSDNGTGGTGGSAPEAGQGGGTSPGAIVPGAEG